MQEQLKLLIRAGTPIISIETVDEPRALSVVRAVCDTMALPLMEWSITQGLVEVRPQVGHKHVSEGKPSAALQFLHDSPVLGVFLFKDLGVHCKDAYIQRQIREAVASCAEKRSTLILIDPVPLPDLIKRFTTPFEIKPPNPEEIEQIIKQTFKKVHRESLHEVRGELTRRDMSMFVQTLRGLNASEASQIVASVIHDDYTLTLEDLPRIVEAKRKLLSRAGCLETIGADVASEDLGGLENLKEWLSQRRGGYTPQAKDFGLDPPRGMLMLGVQGCGKSLCAKVVACDWNMPLLRLDPGVLYQKFIGESESQLRQALRQAEAMAPVVLWIDEIEKAFASASSSSSDGGLSQRMFGTLLSWMQDHREPIFMVATANNISALPPELMRKGRFDEIFFVDLPNKREREGIFKIHLRKRKRDPGQFDLPRLADEAEGFSGAEIEQAIISSLYLAFSDQKPFATEHISKALSKTQPLSVMMGESISSLREWAAERCVPAGLPE